MWMTDQASSPNEHAPLISNRFIAIAMTAVGMLALLSVGISIIGQTFGERWSLGGHTDSPSPLEITIGLDRLQLPANTVRFEEQRASGPTERLDLSLLWPEMAGYTKENRNRFDDVSRADTLLFLQLSQSTMSRDMSGRLDPIYSLLFDGPPEPGPHGLILHRFKAGTGYDGEVLLTATRDGRPDYAVRCILPTSPDEANGGDCQRDIHVGRDLTVLYRFSSTLLGDWQAIDAAIEGYVSARVTGAAPSKLKQMPSSLETKHSS